jgi:hypothetical protein
VYARRIDPLSPDQSLTLLKATAAIAHEGGQRFATDSPEYKVLRRWIDQGAERDDAIEAAAAREAGGHAGRAGAGRPGRFGPDHGPPPTSPTAPPGT